MLTFLAPSGLLALLGIAVPVAIHLWNRRPGRTVPVGSLRWLEATANRRLRSLKLEQLALLLVRIAVVALLAVALASPAWQRPPAPTRGQVFISPDLLPTGSLSAFRPGIDSLRRRGYEVRRLAPGFRLISAAAWRNLDSVAAAGATDSLPADQLWARVRQAADSFPNRPIRVFTSTSLGHFQTSRPALPAQLTWQVVPTADSGAWLQSAYQSGPDSLRLLVGRSTEAAATFRVVRVRKPNAGEAVRVAGLSPLHYATMATGATLQPGDSSSAAVAVSTAPLRIWVRYDAAHSEDARYLRAALQAAAAGLAAPLALTVSAAPPAAAASLDWLFWLSDAPVPAGWQQRVRRGLRLWQDAKAPGQSSEGFLANAATVAPVRILRRSKEAVPATGQSLWADGQGRAVLSYQSISQGSIYQLHTRLHPDWSELADSPNLPALLLDILQPEQKSTNWAADKRALDAAQIHPANHMVSVATSNRPAPDSYLDLRPWAVLATGLLFALERLLAQRRLSFSSTPAA
ncbi:BatA domain-containing protein [Hymenobacter sp. BT491]|uniref:BatA domain-containing protein n=1 Tax=Hymenobacter sp. BT491 TaxID=2766779 RepID=UPI001653B5E2|nr:BatA domain-containing protein [Hymenobacter sp. BT491]MBC6991557.1 BatA domain-containing protein [Hymenobacter sp. BT491]